MTHDEANGLQRPVPGVGLPFGASAADAEDTPEDTAIWNQHVPWSQSGTDSPTVVVSDPDRVSEAALPAVVRPAGAVSGAGVGRWISKKLVLGGALGVVLVGVLLVLLGRPNDPAGLAAPGEAASPTPPALLTAETSVTNGTATFTENNLTIKVSAPCTAFDVEIRIVRTPGVQNVGWATTLSDSQATGSAAGENGVLVYRFTLKPGITIQPGNYVFEIRYNHDPGAGNQTDNTYVASVIQSGTMPAQHLTGHFS